MSKKNQNKFDYNTQVLKVFQKNSDPKLKDFNNKLTPQKNNLSGNNQYGLSIPFLRKLAQQISSDIPEKYSMEEIMASFPIGAPTVSNKISDEEKLLLGLIIAYLKIPLTEKFPYLKQYVPTITTWAICDSFVFKVKDSELKDLWEFLEQYFKSNQEFEIRFAITMGMKNLISPENVKKYLDTLVSLPYYQQHTSYYYVDMALAWALAEAYIRFPKIAPRYLTHSNLSPQVRKYLLQKLKDSFRVSQSEKEKLAKLLS